MYLFISKALEYAKVQVRYRPMNQEQDQPNRSDSNQQRTDNRYSDIYNDGDGLSK